MKRLMSHRTLVLSRAIVAILVKTEDVFSDTGFLDRAITIRGETYRFQVYVPAEDTKTKQWPIVVYLHGNGAQGADGLLPTVHAPADQIRQHAVVVFPQAKEGKRWLYPDMEDLVIAEIDQAIKEFSGDRTRVYLTGFSMGATGAYRIAYRWYDARDIQVDRAANLFVTTADPFSALAVRIGRLPIWIFHGDADQTVPVEQSRHLVPALKAIRPERSLHRICGRFPYWRCRKSLR